MPKRYDDDLRNRDDIAGTLAARQSPVGYGLEQAGRAMAPTAGAFGGALTNTMPGNAVPSVGGVGGSNLAIPQGRPQGMMGAMPGMGMMPGMAASKPRPSPYPAPGQPWPTPRGAPGPLTPREPWQPPDWA